MGGWGNGRDYCRLLPIQVFTRESRIIPFNLLKSTISFQSVQEVLAIARYAFLSGLGRLGLEGMRLQWRVSGDTASRSQVWVAFPNLS